MLQLGGLAAKPGAMVAEAKRRNLDEPLVGLVRGTRKGRSDDSINVGPGGFFFKHNLLILH
jgi:hypothetical protein